MATRHWWPLKAEYNKGRCLGCCHCSHSIHCNLITPQEWNAIPESVRSQKTINSFKNHYDAWKKQQKTDTNYGQIWPKGKEQWTKMEEPTEGETDLQSGNDILAKWTRSPPRGIINTTTTFGGHPAKKNPIKLQSPVAFQAAMSTVI